jgi:hypothetical protein
MKNHYAVVDKESIIWGVGETEEAAFADARDWITRNADEANCDDMEIFQCTQELATAVQLHGGQVRWEMDRMSGLMVLDQE